MIRFVDPWHRERLRRAFDFTKRNLDYVGITLALVAFLVMERVTAFYPPT